ncbi:ATP-binding cassette domain-containing protein [Culicoidibacter larvae]|uniref:ABC transporter ATP-binding protein n=1 Tax=Culicoidibacter larvae TaxID=2579976 RepID=A0A5R8QC72_9FIRM|nr:ABC transporter ATP-binding protein [Culicoidibacter larvae]TLG72712.1 ABC transporter ATP-binding protein [Culicoidibacter larvae]
MITIQNLTVTFKDQKALDIQRPITFNSGDRIGIIGANGAGKSTMINACLGLVPYSGSIDSSVRPEQMAVHLQANTYSELMPISKVIETILNTKIKNNEKLQELIAFFDFEASLKKKYKNLSGGQKQRLTLILVLMQDAPITFFDEVTSGLDFETRQQLMQKVRAWYQGKNATICLVSHYYDELEQLVNKILILDKGKVVDFDYTTELFAKYCGYSVIVLDRTPKHEAEINKRDEIYGPDHLIVLGCQDKDHEQEIAKHLIDKNINFKRSNSDIEIMSYNAILNNNGGKRYEN